MGTLLWQLNDCWPVASWSITDYDNRNPKAAWYAVKEAYRDDKLPLRDVVKPKDLILQDPKITYQIKGNQIVLQSSSFAKYVYLDIPGYKGKLSDNYFDLEPKKPKSIIFKSEDLESKKLTIKVKSLWNINQQYP